MSGVMLGGIDLEGYDNIKLHAESGALIGAMDWDADVNDDYEDMPDGASFPVDEFELVKIKQWIEEGYQNN